MRDRLFLFASSLVLLLSCDGCLGQRRPEGPPPPSDNFPARSWNFEADAPGAVPAGFHVAVGDWAVEQTGDAKSGSRVLAQRAANKGRVFNVLLAEDVTARDLRLKVQIHAREGRIDQGGGLVWRARDGQNYYIARWNPLEDNFRVYKVVDGKRKMLESAKADLDPARWHTLEIEQRGDRVTCSLDGVTLLQAEDWTFREAGTVGLWTKADARTWFDDLELRPLGGS